MAAREDRIDNAVLSAALHRSTPLGVRAVMSAWLEHGISERDELLIRSYLAKRPIGGHCEEWPLQ